MYYWRLRDVNGEIVQESEFDFEDYAENAAQESLQTHIENGWHYHGDRWRGWTLFQPTDDKGDLDLVLTIEEDE